MGFKIVRIKAHDYATGRSDGTFFEEYSLSRPRKYILTTKPSASISDRASFKTLRQIIPQSVEISGVPNAPKVLDTILLSPEDQRNVRELSRSIHKIILASALHPDSRYQKIPF